MESIINTINNVVWNPGLVWLCLGIGLYFSVRTRFMQVRHVPEMLRQVFEN